MWHLSSSIPSWQILTAHAQPLRGARDLAFCLKVPLDSLLVWASSGDSGGTARMRRLTWTFAARIGDKYQIRLTKPTLFQLNPKWSESFQSTLYKCKKHNFFNFLPVWPRHPRETLPRLVIRVGLLLLLVLMAIALVYSPFFSFDRAEQPLN